MNQHVRCLNANAHNAREETNHDMRLVLRSLFQLLRTHLLNLLDLVHDEPQAGHVATKFEQRVGRERHPLRGPQRCETVRGVAQSRLEGPNPEADQTPLHPVDQARALPNEPLALTARALGILLRPCRNGRHVAVIGFAAQPADEDPFEQSRVEAICFRPAMLARDSHAGRMDDVGFDIAGPEPARQPEPVAARLEGDRDAGDRAAFLGGLGTPAHQQPEQVHLAWFELLQRMALDPWNNAGDEPTRLAHLDDRNDRAVLVQGVRDRLKSLSCCAMGRSIALLPATMVTSRHRLPHSISGETFWSVSNGVSKPFFAALLALFAREAGAGRERMIVLGLDSAGWHTEPNLVVPDGIRLAYPACLLAPVLARASARRAPVACPRRAARKP